MNHHRPFQRTRQFVNKQKGIFPAEPLPHLEGSPQVELLGLSAEEGPGGVELDEVDVTGCLLSYLLPIWDCLYHHHQNHLHPQCPDQLTGDQIETSSSITWTFVSSFQVFWTSPVKKFVSKVGIEVTWKPVQQQQLLALFPPVPDDELIRETTQTQKMFYLGNFNINIFLVFFKDQNKVYLSPVVLVENVKLFTNLDFKGKCLLINVSWKLWDIPWRMLYCRPSLCRSSEGLVPLRAAGLQEPDDYYYYHYSRFCLIGVPLAHYRISSSKLNSLERSSLFQIFLG